MKKNKSRDIIRTLQEILNKYNLKSNPKTAEATDDFLGSKIADKIAWVKKNSNQIHLIKQETEENTGMSGKATETKAKRQIYFILEERHTIISELIQKKDI